MQRAELINNLQNVAPALSENTLIPLLTHFWFTGKQLMAFNDQIALAMPYRSEFKGAVPSKLLDLLRVGGESRDEVMELNANSGTHLKVRVGRSRLQLAMLEPQFVFELPPATVNPSQPLNKLIAAIEHCLVSVGTDTSAPEYLGITLEQEDDRIAMYATDGGSLSHMVIRAGLTLPDERVILPASFCRQMLRLAQANGDGPATFAFGQRTSGGSPERYALFLAGDAVLYGRLLESRSPLPFHQVIGDYLPAQYRDQLIPVPREFADALERAFIVCDPQRKRMELKVEGGRLKLLAQTDVEEVSEAIPFRGHDDVTLSVEPRLIRRGLPLADKMMFSDRCVVLADKKGRRLYLVSCG